MIAFELTMPNKGSWNNRWSGETKRYIRCKREWGFSKETLEKIINKDYTYSWNDGWTACVSVRKVDGKTAKHLIKISNGFYGYDWRCGRSLVYGRFRGYLARCARGLPVPVGAT